MDRKNELLIRVYLILILFLGIAGVIGWKIISISLFEGTKWKALQENRYLKWRPVKAQRGDIYGDDGERLIASSIEFFEIRMDPVAPGNQEFNEGIVGLCIGLEKVLNTKSSNEWSRILRGARRDFHQSKKSGSRNILISKKVDDATLQQLKSLPILKQGKNKGGLIVNRYYARKKTYQEMASRSIGEYREKDMVGIEMSYDDILRGAERKELMRFIPPDLWIPLYDPTDFEVTRGKDIVTTLNIDIQDVVHHELQSGIMENNAKAGVLVVMDVKTGYIKAISNLDVINGQCREIENRAVTMRTEPGSTIKAATVLALLEAGVQPSTEVRVDKGRKKFYDLWMYDSNYPHDRITSDLKESFIESSNVGIATLAQQSFSGKSERMFYYNQLQQFGLIEKTGIDLIGEPESIVKHPIKDAGKWSGVTVPWMAHGYELQVTPLQTLAFYNAIANDGIYMKPRLVQAVKYGHKVVKQFKPQSKKQRIASPENIRELQDMMKEVVRRGTGKKMYSTEYEIAGKTGTTSFNYAGGGEKGHHASFAGYFPADDPKYSMIVIVYGLHGLRYYGSEVAGPIFKKVADRIMALEGGLEMDFVSGTMIGMPENLKGFGGDFEELYEGLGKEVHTTIPRWTKIENDGSTVFAEKAKFKNSTIPDVKGMGLRDAMYVLENIGIKVEVHGTGKVYRQSVRPGSKLTKEYIEIYLN